jgi:PhzF family phenazine biosynthesis protein
MKIPYYHVDVFSGNLFEGNPAGVCLLPDGWLPDETLQNIAAENNLSETAFVVQEGGTFKLRWFTPTVEMDLCGHATVAPAHVLFNELQFGAHEISFETASGPVSVARDKGLLVLDFPSRPAVECSSPEDAEKILSRAPQACLKSRDYLFVFKNESEVRSLSPDFQSMEKWDTLGVIVTAPGDTADFVSRFFAPGAGVNEDPVTGSAHCTLIPYWAERLGKDRLDARQVSARGGQLSCRQAGERVKIGGTAVTYLQGELTI